MAFDFSTLITDRSPEDLQALRDLLSTPMSDWTAEQLAAFNQAASKGAYNYTDLNRVTACMDYLNERLTALGYVTGYQRIKVHDEPDQGPPQGYTQLEYIESSGGQFIDTGVKPDQDTVVSARVSDWEPSTAEDGIFGSRNANTTQYWVYFRNQSGGYALRWGEDTANRLVSANQKDISDIRVESGSLTVNGVTYEKAAGENFSVPYNMYLFAINNAGKVQYPSRARFYSFRMSNKNGLIRDFVPCRNENGKAGMYDLETEKFYGNSGSGVFTAGPEIPAPDPQDPYTWYEGDVPTASSMMAYLANVSALRGVLTLGEGIPAVPGDMVGLTLAEANVIEQILDTINDYLVALQKIFLRSDMVWAISGGPGFYFTN